MLRVLAAFQEVADRPLVDVAVVADALSMPSWTDRNKSLYLLQFLVEDLKPEDLKAQRASLIQKLGASLVALATSA